MTVIVIALLVALGVGGGTVVAADSARPGDTLYGLDQALEKTRLNLAGENNKDKLRVRFAQERLDEVKDLIEEDSDEEDTTIESTGISETTVTEIEADVFTNETIVKIEFDDQKSVFATQAKTKEAIVAAIAARYSTLSVAFIDKTLSVGIEDRASRVGDKKVNVSTNNLSDENEVKVLVGIEHALNLLAEVKGSAGITVAELQGVTAELNTFLATLPANARVQAGDDRIRIKFDNGPEKIEVKETGNKTKIESRTEEGRVRIEVKNGQIEIKTKIEDDEDEHEHDSEDEEDDAPEGLEEVEATVFSDKTVVEVEYNDEKTTFITTANTKEGIIQAVIAKFPTVTSAQVSAVLEIDTEDGSSDDDSDADEEDKDDDSDEDDSLSSTTTININ